MTKQHFEAVAAAMLAARQSPPTEFTRERQVHEFAVDGASRRLATEFARFNPRFDRDRFLKACGVPL